MTMLKLHTREEGGETALNMTPLIDMVFILLIFFAVNATFVEVPGVEIDRPSAQTASSDANTNVLIAVTESGVVIEVGDQARLAGASRVAVAAARPSETP